MFSKSSDQKKQNGDCAKMAGFRLLWSLWTIMERPTSSASTLAASDLPSNYWKMDRLFAVKHVVLERMRALAPGIFTNFKILLVVDLMGFLVLGTDIHEIVHNDTLLHIKVVTMLMAHRASRLCSSALNYKDESDFLQGTLAGQIAPICEGLPQSEQSGPHWGPRPPKDPENGVKGTKNLTY